MDLLIPAFILTSIKLAMVAGVFDALKEDLMTGLTVVTWIFNVILLMAIASISPVLLGVAAVIGFLFGRFAARKYLG